MPPKSDTNVSAHTRISGAFDVRPPIDPAAYDAWFRAKVQEALDDPHPGYPNEEVKAHFTRRRAETLRQLEENDE